jgi:hypothetical protein
MDAHSKKDGDHLAVAALGPQSQALKERVDRDDRLQTQRHECRSRRARMRLRLVCMAPQQRTRLARAGAVGVDADPGGMRVDDELRLANLVPKQPRNMG